jgi:hypothetical protein
MLNDVVLLPAAAEDGDPEPTTMLPLDDDT